MICLIPFLTIYFLFTGPTGKIIGSRLLWLDSIFHGRDSRSTQTDHDHATGWQQCTMCHFVCHELEWYCGM
jgi:hypothetical protein